MMYHYGDIKQSWLNDPHGLIGYDVPLLLEGDYESKIMLATVALNIGINIGLREGQKLCQVNEKP